MTGNPVYVCDNCDACWGSIDELNPAVDLAERLDVGGEVPAGECPDCGALCYEAEPDGFAD